MGLCLIPVGGAAVVIVSMVGVTMLDSDLDAFLEVYRVLDVVAVPCDFSAPVLASGYG